MLCNASNIGKTWSILVIWTIIASVEAIGNVSVSYSFDIDPSPAPLSALSLKKSSSSNVERAIVLSRQQNNAIVQRHNELRTIVQPTATKMRKFTWDKELADVATKYSRKCIYEHNKARKHSRFSYIGENLFISMGISWSTSLVTNAVSAWDAEKEDYDYTTRKCKPGKKCGHYTQTAWDDTFKVGCGVTICRRATVNGKIWRSATLFACNYGPGGNYDRHPFVSGPSCSNCDRGDVCEDNLCTNPLRDINFDVTAGQWSEWSQWSPCTKTCIGGFATRKRTCSTFVTSDCKGFSEELSFECGKSFCNPNLPGGAGNAEYGPWGAWSQCSVTCGSGTKTRTRQCKRNFCTGFNRMSFSCNAGSCTAATTTPSLPKGTWKRWGQWGACSVTCGAGMRKRRRTCRGSNCRGSAVNRQKCNLGLCQGKWSKWSTWSSCTVTCGGGSRARGRSCTTGTNCIGTSEEIKVCNLAKCPGEFSTWSSWAQCSRSCGPGTTFRFRTCTTSSNCIGRRKQQKSCNDGTCPEFGDWTKWSSCDASCGSGSRSRTRFCSSGIPEDCTGQASQSKICSQRECLNPGWNVWSTWNSCNATCGAGWKTRSRTCHGGYPGSKACPGYGVHAKSCQRRKCPEYTQWSDWSRCSATCGPGIKSRIRYCQFGGGCEGDNTQEQSCTLRGCIQSSWGNWQKWSNCSEDCGEGVHTRTRPCLLGLERIPCSGDSDESWVCNIRACEGNTNQTTGGNRAGINAASRLLILTVVASFLRFAHV